MMKKIITKYQFLLYALLFFYQANAQLKFSQEKIPEKFLVYQTENKNIGQENIIFNSPAFNNYQYSAPKNPATFTFANVTGNQGQNVTVAVSVSNITDLAGYQWTIEYDDTKLEYVACSDWYSGLAPDILNPATLGKITFVYSSATGTNVTAGLFFNITFKIKSTAVGTTELIWSDVPTSRYLNNSVPAEIPTTWNNGTITINSPELSISDVTGIAGASVAVPVTALNISDLVGFQFTVDYDETKLTYVNCSNWHADVVSSAVIVVNDALNGKLTFAYNEYPATINIADGKYFDINFTIAAGASGSAAVDWSDSPTLRELSNSVPEVIGALWNNGSVTITPASATVLDIDDVNGVAGLPVTVPVNASNVTDMVGFQFTVDYDQTKLTYSSCSGWNASVNLAELYIVDDATNGRLSIVYNDYPNEIEIVSGLFFNINFNVLAGATGIAPVIWSDTPTLRELSNSVPAAISATWIDGSVTITVPTNPILTIEEVSGTAGLPVSVPVNAVSVTGLVGFQWTIDYDETRLSYNNCSDWDADVNLAELIIVNDAVNGTLSFSYNDYPSEIEIVSGLFFNINFNVLAGATGIAPVIWSDTPTLRELSNAIPEEIPATWNNGRVIICISWDGSASSEWQDVTNWTPENIPTALDDIVIPASCPNYPIVHDGATTAVCHNMTIDAGANVQIAINGQMTVSGTLTNNVGAAGLIVKSDASGDGSLILNNSGVEATVERFVTGNRWHLMFPSLNAIPKTVFTTEGANTNYNFYSYNEANEDYWNTTVIYGTSGWTSEVGAGNTRTDKGFLFNRYNSPDKNYIQTGGNLEFDQKVFDVNYSVSSVVIGNGVTQTRDYFDGWNLVGNPFSSSIDWDQVILNGIESGIYYYDGASSNYKYYMQSGDGTQLPPYNVGISVNGGSRYAPSGQGFMVKTINTGLTHASTFTIPITAKSHNDQMYWKSTERIPNLIKINVSTGDFIDETVIRTLPTDVTTEHDARYDAYKMFAWDKSKPQIYSVNNEQTKVYAINSLPEFTEAEIIPLGVYFGTDGKYQISSVENNFDNYTVYLHDITENKYIEMPTGTAYSFETATGDFLNRFELVFQKLSTNIDSQENFDFSVFPNPAYDNFTILCGKNNLGGIITLTDIAGKICYQTVLNNENQSIGIENQAQGVYFVQLKRKNGTTINKKIIIQ